jgi:DNA-binding SARP family transcriptional activator/tetratricopeptide (TPR) repeat protein
VVQVFLMRTSLLHSVYPKLAAVICEIDDLEAGRRVAEAERVGLLSRRSDTHGGGRRYHPLVQEFLEARLRRDFGDEEVVRLHRLIARHAAATDWRLAAHHFAEAGDIDDLHRLVEASVPSIMAGGDFAIAESFIDRLPDGRTRPIFEIVLSRMELRRDRPTEAVRLAESAVAAQRSSGPSAMLDQSLANLTSVYHQTGRLRESLVAASELCVIGQSKALVSIGRAMIDLVKSSVDGSLDDALATLRGMAAASRQVTGDLHYFGITQLNIGEVERAKGNAAAALEAANAAIGALRSSSAGHDMPAARAIRAWALLHLGERAEGLDELAVALRSEFHFVSDESRIETASILAEYVGAIQARDVLSGLGPAQKLAPDLRDQWVATLAEIDLAEGHPEMAFERLSDIDVNQPHRETAAKTRVLMLRAISAALSRSPNSVVFAEAAHLSASAQGASRWAVQAEFLIGALAGSQTLDGVLRKVGEAGDPWASVLAELFLSDLIGESPVVQALLDREVPRRPGRWLPGLRRALVEGNSFSQMRAAALLDVVGEPSDVPFLRAFSRRAKARSGSHGLGKGLSRRVADRVLVSDLGRVRVHVGSRTVDGDSVRRKVLALLCFLIARPRMEATRDQVVDALWPEQDPAAASNSLNQTVYFLRRVFEPKYLDDLSPGYLRHETDLLWLDPELVGTESEACRHAIDASRKSSTWASIDLVSRIYRGRFALDFEYEEWSVNYRDNLHASDLEVIERAVSDEIQAARFDRAIQLCRRVLDIDATSEPIERHLLSLYRLTGAHAAAEEQYRHYAGQVQDDLDIDPPPLDQI